MVIPWIIAGVTIWWAHRRAGRAQQTADEAIRLMTIQAKNDVVYLRQVCKEHGLDPDKVSREGAEFVGPDGLINEAKVEAAKERARQAVRDAQVAA